MKLFQFHKVQLTRNMSGKLRSDSERFQFHKVQLTLRLIEEGPDWTMFQFHKVQLTP